MTEQYPYPNITAAEDSIKTGQIRLPRFLGSRAEAIGGTLLLSENGGPRATMSVLATSMIGSDPTEVNYDGDPLAVIMNGGPSTPSTLWSQQIFGSFYHVNHGLDGHIGEIPTHYPLSLDHSALAWRAKVFAVDPVGVGTGRVLEGIDNDWANNSDTDATAASAAVEWFYKSLGGYRPVYLVGSSFRARQLPLMVLDLERRGIKVDGMAIISGHYDIGLTDYENRDDPRHTINALGALAVCAHEHVPTAFSADTPAELVFDLSRAYAEGEYTNYLRDGKGNRDSIARKLAALTGLSIDLVQEHSLRISPKVLTENLLPGQVISRIDSRLVFLAGDYRIDPALDTWEKIYRDIIRSRPSEIGYSPVLDEDYRGIIQIPQWRHTGLVADGRAHKAMQLVMERNPDMVIRAYNGFFDLNTPPPSTEIFFDELSAMTGMTVQHHREGTYDMYRRPDYVETGVAIFTVPMGHQLTRSGIQTPRELVLRSIQNMIGHYGSRVR